MHLPCPMSPSVFDGHIFYDVLLWLADPTAALAEAGRVTRHGGADHRFPGARLPQLRDAPELWMLLARLQPMLCASKAPDFFGQPLPELCRSAGLSRGGMGNAAVRPTKDPELGSSPGSDLSNPPEEDITAVRRRSMTAVYPHSHLFCWAVVLYPRANTPKGFQIVTGSSYQLLITVFCLSSSAIYLLPSAFLSTVHCQPSTILQPPPQKFVIS